MSNRSENTAKALYTFFSGFGIPAYLSDDVPEEAQLPYITYDLAVPDVLQDAHFSAEVWYRSRSAAALNAKVDEIESAIGEGVSIPTDAGAVRIYRDAGFRQTRTFPGDPTYRCAYLSMTLAADTF